MTIDLKQFEAETHDLRYERIFLLSDLHFGVRANSLEWLTNQESFFRDFYIPFLRRNVRPGDVLFMLGDWFDSRQLIDISVLNVSVDIMLELAGILPVHIMAGNHDCAKKYETDVNSIVAFRYIPNVTVYERPTVATDGKTRILVLPWIGNKEDEENYVRANRFDYVFAHADISGFRYDNGKEIGSDAADFTKFKEIKRLFSGHIHKRQERKNFVYIGSPYHTKRSDIGNTKAVYVFDPKANTFTATENTFSPVYQKVPLESMLELTLSEAVRLLDNNYTDVLVSDNHIHLFNLAKLVDVLKDCRYKKIETFNQQPRIDGSVADVAQGTDVDVLTLLEDGIGGLGHRAEAIVRLKLMNKTYYEKAKAED